MDANGATSVSNSVADAAQQSSSSAVLLRVKRRRDCQAPPHIGASVLGHDSLAIAAHS
jgi:hypothetical protein